MDANDYQRLAARTLLDDPGFEIEGADWDRAVRLTYFMGSFGVFVEAAKKRIFHRHPVPSDEWVLYSLSRHIKNLVNRGTSFVDQTKENVMLIWNLVGLIGEVGELANCLVDVMVTGKMDRAVLVKEIGDVLWYTAGLCTKLGIPFGEVMEVNIQKLRERYPDGFSSDASINRAD